ncbi:hypothetical protein D6D13_06118 [Aureobasidium pullulans]|uniref:Uncharacterized protein n=1 Tax=Aureobasidium pullulans TaxID=5580 RepID=A0A4S9CSR3_AURPU|nr:hypothetical protein D6D13_06118 [Aureobasidium pullulans]
MPTTHAFYGRPTLLRMTFTMTIDDCFAFAFLMIAVLLSSVLPWLSVKNLSRFEGVVVIAEEQEDAYKPQFLCWQRRAYIPVKSIMKLTTTKDSSEGLASSIVNGGGTHMRLAVVALTNVRGSIMQSEAKFVELPSLLLVLTKPTGLGMMAERREQCGWQPGLGL